MTGLRRSLGCLNIAMAGLVVACNPTFGDQTSLVAGPRLLAVQASPAEAVPGTGFSLTALYVAAGGIADASTVSWATCTMPKPLGDPGPIDPGCFVDASSGLLPLGEGESVNGAVPSNACQLFGPDSPPPTAGQPAARPTDPDSTGGFYLPIRIETSSSAFSAALERITCQPSGVSQSVFTSFSSGYLPNQNPVIASLSRLDADGGTTTIPPLGHGVSAGLTVSPGERVSFQAAWPTCPTTPTLCGGAEAYLYIDPTSKEITTQRESMVVSWYATAGTFDLDRVGRDAADLATTAVNGWVAPPSSGPLSVWIVVRDARGGVGWESYAVSVE